MPGRLILISFLGVGLLSTKAFAQTPYPYSPANYINGGDPQVLRIFALTGEAIQVPLPFVLGRVAFGPDGKSLYVARGRLLKIEFNPVRVSSILGTEGFVDVSGMAVSKGEDKILISGTHVQGDRRDCGLFEVKTSDGSLRRVQSSGCEYISAWTKISLSPTAERAVGRHNRSFQIIDLINGATAPLGTNLESAEWSPDGNWIAAVGGEPSRLWLVDPKNLLHRRDLGEYDGGAWSPDSRYLLLFSHSLGCGAETSSMEALEVASGKRSEIKSSRCQIVGGASGWVSADIRR
jgi:hypothetical protein